MTVASYVIHLERAAGRYENAKHLCRVLGPRASIIPAIDGQKITDLDIAAFCDISHRPRFPFSMQPAEVAAFLSHRSCWQRLIYEGHDAALILEDDVAIDALFHAAMHFVIKNLGPQAFVRFPLKRRETPILTLASNGEMRLFQPKVVGLGMLAQIVTRSAAERLLEASVCFDRPIDAFMQLTWVHRVNVQSVWPSGIGDASHLLGGSTIHNRKSPLEKIKREISRPIYRIAVDWKSRQFRHAP